MCPPLWVSHVGLFKGERGRRMGLMGHLARGGPHTMHKPRLDGWAPLEAARPWPFPPPVFPHGPFFPRKFGPLVEYPFKLDFNIIFNINYIN